MALALLVLWIQLGLPMLARWGAAPAKFTLDEVRVPQNLPPYDPRARLEESVTLFGPFGREHYAGWANQPLRLWNFYKPEETTRVFEAAVGETLTLPAGERIRIRAIKLLPQSTTCKNDIPIDNIFCDAHGKWMPRDEAISLNRQLGNKHDPTKTRNGYCRQSTAYLLDVVVQTDFAFEDCAGLAVADVKTGANLGCSGWVPRAEVPASEDALNHFITYECDLDGVRPTPLALHMNVRQGKEQLVTLGAAIPQSFTVDGRRHTLLALKDEYYSTMYFDGQRHLQRSSRLVFDSLPGNILEIHLYDREGTELYQEGAIWRRQGRAAPEDIRPPNEIWFQGAPEQFHHLFIRIRPDPVRVILNLPDLPIIPEANRKTDDLMEMVLPETKVIGDLGWRILIRSCLQVGYDPTVVPATLTPLQPVDVTGKTVRELLAMDAARYPPHEMVLITRGEGPRLDRVPPGTTRPLHAPWLTALTLSLQQMKPRLILIIAVLTLWKTLSLWYASRLRRALRLRGFDEITIWQAEYLASRLGSRAWRIPPYDHIATLPGATMDDLRYVVRLMRHRPGR